MTFTLLLLAVAVAAGCADTARLKRNTGAYGSVPAERSDGGGGAPGALKKSRPYTVLGQTYYPLADAYGFTQEGIASWYGPTFHGKKTANGETYDMYAMTAAHKTLPLGTMVEVHCFDTGRSVVLRVNDRGPFVADRIIDLSKEGADRLGLLDKGTGRVRVTALAEGRPASSPDGGPIISEPIPDFEHGLFYVQVGAFSVRANAERLQGALGYPLSQVRLVAYVDGGGRGFTRVQVGPFTSMALADEALTNLLSQGMNAPFVVAD
jgi:rare lipoprotein A